MKVVTVLGTRPEIIRLSCVIPLLDKFTDHVIVHTGQNYDYELNDVFFKDLKVRKPNYFMNVDTSSLGSVYGNVLIEAEKIFKKEKPNAVLILGDTNSAIAAIIAKRMKIPIYHMEAGNRSFDPNVPEEINRKIIDHISDYNLVYTEHARRHLLSEGLHHRRIYLTGSPMKEVLNANIKMINSSKVLERLKIKKGRFFLASFHREENVDNSKNLKNILKALSKIVREFRLPIIVSTHPRTKNRLKKLGRKNISKQIKFLKPFGFHDYQNLQKNAKCVISDSGTISEESAILNFPAVTIRNAIERPEAIDAGTIIMTGVEPQVVVDAIKMQTSPEVKMEKVKIPESYEVDNCSQRTVNILLGTYNLSHIWDNIRINDLN
jgi:UDP-N-acetylglucosamine 2-epimerase (non-hydrolysing)